MINKIIENLYIGNIYDVLDHGNKYSTIVNVMTWDELGGYEQDLYSLLKPLIIYAPYLESEHNKEGISTDQWANPLKLQILNEMIHTLLTAKHSVLIHCAAAQERSPLVAIWYLHNFKNYSIDQAYDLVKQKHSPTQDRRNWLKKCSGIKQYDS
jgi:hypothetical protein